MIGTGAGRAIHQNSFPPQPASLLTKDISTAAPWHLKGITYPLDPTFCDHALAYRSKTNRELLHSLLVLRICSAKSTNYVLEVVQRILEREVFASLKEYFIIKHFHGGKTLKDIDATLKKLKSVGVKPVLEYFLDDDVD